jgi:hypothetical protein
MLSSDAGRSWRPADFGASRAIVPADAALDQAAAESAANRFELYATVLPREPYQRSAWDMLSSYSQKAFQSVDVWAAQQAIPSGVGASWELDAARHGPDVLSAQNLGSDLWRDLTANAIMARAYVVSVSHPSASWAEETLVVAPFPPPASGASGW